LRSTLSKSTDEIAQINKQWGIEIKERVDEERDGRLARLDVLANSLEILASAVVSVGDGFREGERRRVMGVGLIGLDDAIENGGDVEGWVKMIRDVAGGEMIVSVLDGVRCVKKDEVMKRFEGVERELWRTQFIGDEVGPVLYCASWFASYFVFWSGEGNEVGCILERARNFMEVGDIDSAAREVNQVAGAVGQEVARDWLEIARE
jgi:mitofilin